MQKQTKATTTKATTKAATTTKGGVITMPKPKAANKVVNSTVPPKAVKAAHKVTKPLVLGKAPVKVAAPVAPPLGVPTLAQSIVTHKGALVPAIVALFTSHAANNTILNNKTTAANLYHAFIAFNGSTNMLAISKTHSCLPAHYYLKGATIGNASSFVNDAKRPKHYCCSAFAGIYTANLKPANVKALSLLNINMAVCLPTLQAWQSALGFKGAVNQKGFTAFINKLIA